MSYNSMLYWAGKGYGVKKTYDHTAQKEKNYNERIFVKKTIPQYIDELGGLIKSNKIEWSKIRGGYIFYYKECKFVLKDGLLSVMHNNIIHNYGKDLSNKLLTCINLKIKNMKDNTRSTCTNTKAVIKRVVEIRPDYIIVKSNNSYCLKNHDTEDIEAVFSICRKDGKIVTESVSAFYCKKCDVYYLSEKAFELLKKRGVILCRIISKKMFLDGTYNQPINSFEFAQESILYQMGYTVASNKNLSDYQRHCILGCIIDNKIMTRNQIISYLTSFVNIRRYQEKYQNAINKWEYDIKYVLKYNMDDLRKVVFR